MAVVIESNNTASSSASDTVTITKPTGLAVDDLMVAVIYAHDTSGTPGLNTPSGWSLAGGEADALTGGDIIEFAIFYKLADSGDVVASNFSFTADSTMDYMDGVILRVSGIRTDADSLNGYSEQTLTATDNPTYTVSLTPDPENDLYVVVCMSGKSPYTATDLDITGTDPTWTRYLNVAHTVDDSSAFQVFAAVDATPESSITSVDPTETGSDTGTDSVCGFAIFTGITNASYTVPFATNTNTAFAPTGSAGASYTVPLASNTNTAFAPTGAGYAPTKWTPTTKS